MNKKKGIPYKIMESSRYRTAILKTDFGYLKINELKDGWTYRIFARNAYIGIWQQEEKGFIISRFKFEHNYLFVEDHWDTGAPHGTVKPFFEIEKAPLKKDELSYADESPKYHEKLKYLNELSNKFPFDEEVKRFWEHIKQLWLIENKKKKSFLPI